MKDATSQLRSATQRAKSDVANKLVSMFLHALSRKVAQNWTTRVDSLEYEELVRRVFANCCPYCSRDLSCTDAVVEHLDGMNRRRAGLHVPGNVLVACRRCNGEKRRDDSQRVLVLASTGWESFLSHNGSRCAASCLTCRYWNDVWPDETERKLRLSENLERIRSFRRSFHEFGEAFPNLAESLPALLAKLYSDCQAFASEEIKLLLQKFDETPVPEK